MLSGIMSFEGFLAVYLNRLCYLEPMAGKQTPLMRQYWEIKNQHLDKILLFRMGDFFEIFHKDAEIAAPILNIALTQRNKKSADDTKMCGMPHHSVGVPIGKLLAVGHKVAICDQVEDPKIAQGIVKRAITRILSPGMVYDPETLDELQANYLCSFDNQSVSFLETSTGEAFYYLEISEKNSIRQRLLESLNPVELVLSTELKAECFTDEMSHYHISSHEINDEIPSEFKKLPLSAQRLVSYAHYMQGECIYKSICPFERRQLQKVMSLQPTMVRHLEIFRTYKGDIKGSLFHSINRTKTSSGARLLKSWLNFPLTDVKEISVRQDEVQAWYERTLELRELRQVLSGMGDIERRLSQIGNPNCNPRDLLSLSESLRTGLSVSPFCAPGKIEESHIRVVEELVHEIEKTISKEAPVVLHRGGVICQGLDPKLDELIKLSEDGQKLLLEMEEREKKSTGIASLKIRYNNVFGYYIEVTNVHKDKVPNHYKRKQTLSNAERYLTQELQELEDRILSAKAKRVEKEQVLFGELCAKTLDLTSELLLLSRVWSELDVLSGLAYLAQEHNYKRPQFSTDQSLELRACRHPVVEQEVDLPFVPNNVVLGKGECLLLTGPNMAGKSTIMRQVAVISLMAQLGSFVPADKAVLPIFYQIFTRIGASDFLTEGLSTFMVEMRETSEMLKLTNENSLVILDEVGRGTSTYDGMSLAQAILEFLVTKKRSMTLFATHYHELTSLSRLYPQVRNGHMSIREKNGDIHFLHTLVQGAANKSYGIQVARLAGLPREVTHRAALLLQKLEVSGPADSDNQLSLVDSVAPPPIDEAEGKNDKLLQEICSMDVQELTPLEALNQISRWQKDMK